MKTFSSWWFSWYAAGRAENATTKNSGTSNSDSGGNEEAATATAAVMTGNGDENSKGDSKQ